MSATADLLPPFDPTGYTSITGAQLYQYLSGAAPASDTGFTIVSTDADVTPVVPDANTYTKWQRYLWVRITASSVNAYLWNPTATSDPTYLKWVSVNVAGIGVGAVTGSMIADNTITDAKIISLDYTKLTGVPSTFSPGGAAGGDLTGTYPNPSVANGAITGAKIAGTTITHANLAAQAVEVPTDIKPAAVGLSLIRTNAGATALEYFVPQQITTLANPASASDVDKVATVTTPYTDGFVLKTIAELTIPITFTSAELAIVANTKLADVAHGLTVAGVPTIPKQVRAVIRCKTAEGNYAIGDEVDIVGVCSPDAGGVRTPAFSVGASATNVFVNAGVRAAYIIMNKNNGTEFSITLGNWKVVIYARL